MNLILFAQISPERPVRSLRGMAKGFQHPPDYWQDTGAIVVSLALVGLLVAFALWLKFYGRAQKRVSYNKPKALFGALCRAHRLVYAERRLLKSLARGHKLKQPARLFLEPARFDVESLGGRWRKRQPRLVALRGRLFGEV